MRKNIIILGAGISGLTAGCYCQMNGYEAEVFEMQGTPGGLCTSWSRKGYLMDGCIDWLIGSNPDSLLYDFWNELGAFDHTELIHHDEVMQVEDGLGKRLVLYSDADRLEKHLLELSPEDAPLIIEFTDAIRKCAFFSKTVQTVFNDRFNSMSMHDFLQQFKDPFLREALSVCLLPLDPKEYIVGGLVFRLSFYNRKDACWPVGGSLEFARKIERKFITLHGKVHYNSEVKEIITQYNQATGIRLTDGSEHYADYIISTVDSYRTLFGLLNGKYVNDEIKALYDDKKALPASMQVSLGIDCDLSDEPHSLAIKLDSPLIAGNAANTHLFFKHFCFDRVISNPGKSVITSIIKTDYAYWEALYKDPELYLREKERICKVFVEAIEGRFPQVKGKIQVTDVATPVTYHRYTGAWKGSYMGWWGVSEHTVPTELPELKNFCMAGQWTEPSGGIPTAMMSARRCVAKMCMEDGKGFS